MQLPLLSWPSRMPAWTSKKMNPEKRTARRGGQYRLKGLDSFRAGVILGFGTEAMELVEYYHEKFLATKGTRGISPFGLPNFYMSSFTSHVAQCFSLRGSSYAVSTACASGTHAMINSFIHIQGGGRISWSPEEQTPASRPSCSRDLMF